MIGRAGTRLELEDIQGNVLQGYGLGHAAYVGVQVAGAAAGRALVGDLRGHVLDARPWNGAKPDTALNLAVSHAGLRALGAGEAALATFPPEFAEGMAARAERLLGDTAASRPDGWEEGLRAGEVHVLAVLHARSAELLKQRLQWLRERIGRHGALSVGSVQRARMLEEVGADYGREHFGYSDGFAQPAVEGAPGRQQPGQGVPTRFGWRALKAGEFVLGYPDEDGVLPAAPAAPLGRNGTFMVYRKLQQDVVGFRRLLRELADEHYSGDVELVAAKIAGRWRDGTPLMLSPDAADPALAADKARTNDFRYRDDPRGALCPLGAHVRRANPRDGLVGGGRRSRRHRILRRGMPYGEPLPPGLEDDGAERGLVFVCFNASIVRQFEMVNRWLLDGDAFGLGAERDFMLGADEPGEGKLTVQGDPPTFLAPQPPLVRTRGGEYLFLPGLTALEALSG